MGVVSESTKPLPRIQSPSTFGWHRFFSVTMLFDRTKRRRSDKTGTSVVWAFNRLLMNDRWDRIRNAAGSTRLSTALQMCHRLRARNTSLIEIRTTTTAIRFHLLPASSVSLSPTRCTKRRTIKSFFPLTSHQHLQSDWWCSARWRVFFLSLSIRNASTVYYEYIQGENFRKATSNRERDLLERLEVKVVNENMNGT